MSRRRSDDGCSVSERMEEEKRGSSSSSLSSGVVGIRWVRDIGAIVLSI